MRHNARTTLPRRRHTPMQQFDRLPPGLRRWLHDAALPWSAVSALRIWASAGSEAEALARLAAVEARLIARDAPLVWGAQYPTVHRAG